MAGYAVKQHVGYTFCPTHTQPSLSTQNRQKPSPPPPYNRLRGSRDVCARAFLFCVLGGCFLVATLLAGAAYSSFQVQTRARTHNDVEHAFVIISLTATVVEILAMAFSLTTYDHLGRCLDIHVQKMIQHYDSIIRFPRYLALLGGCMYFVAFLLQGYLHFPYFLQVGLPVSVGIGIPLVMALYVLMRIGWHGFKQDVQEVNLYRLDSSSDGMEWAIIRKKGYDFKKRLLRRYLAIADLTALIVRFIYSGVTRQIEVMAQGSNLFEQDAALSEAFVTLAAVALVSTSLALFLSYYLQDRINSTTEEALPALARRYAWAFQTPHLLNWLSLAMLLAMVTLQAIMDYANGTEVAIWTVYGIGAIAVGMLVCHTHRVENEYRQEIDEGATGSAALLAAAVKNLSSPLREAYMNFTFDRAKSRNRTKPTKRKKTKKNKIDPHAQDYKDHGLQRRRVDLL